jgi:small GTP-binding protein
MEENNSTAVKNTSLSLENWGKSHFLSNQEASDISYDDDVREFKIILIGSSSVGKTSIFHKFTSEEFSTNYKATLTVESRVKYLKIDKNLYVKLNLWDTCGAEKYLSLTRQYYRDAQAAILVFDLTNQNTFNDLKNIWLNDIKNHGDKNIEIAIVGNKLDLIEKRKVTESQVVNFCRENGYRYIEASAKEGTNILKIFEEISFVLAKNDKKQRVGEKEMEKHYLVENYNDNNENLSQNKKSLCC